MLTEPGLDGILHPRFYQGDLTPGDSLVAGTQLSTERQISLRVQRIKSLGVGRTLVGTG